MARDYKGENRRRNDRARALGYPSYAAMRRALETGKIQRTDGKVQSSTEFDRRPLYKRAGFNTPQEYMQTQRENKDWAKKHAQAVTTKNPIKGFEKEYNIAFVKHPNKNKLLDMKAYLVDATGIYTAAQFDRKYLKK